jgi:pyrimidine 5'-nucleotidase
MLERLPQEKWIFTNSDHAHAQRVLNALGIEKHFKGILDIIKMEFNNKPSSIVYKSALNFAGNPKTENCLFADDSEKNLGPAKELGFHTVLVGASTLARNHHYHIQSIHQLQKVIEEIETKSIYT